MKNYVRAGEVFPREGGRIVPTWDTLAPLPAASAAGACMCADERGTGRYIYVLLSLTSFWRYDSWTNAWNQLTSPPAGGAFAAGTCMVYDPSRNYVWLLVPKVGANWACFYSYNCATDVWSADLGAPAGLAAQWGTDGAMTHTCTTYNAAGNDDKIYLIGNAATAIHCYTVGVGWAALANPVPLACGAGCGICWEWGINNDKLLVMRGTATATFYDMVISTNTWSAALAITGNVETFTTGSMAEYVPPKHWYISRDATTRILRLDIAALAMGPARTFGGTHGGAIVGDGFVYMKSKSGRKYLYERIHTGTTFYRSMLGEA